MCVILCKPGGVKMPTEKIIETCWTNNPHGAGLAWPVADGVKIDKGYMTLKDLKKRLHELKNEIDLTRTPLLMHFRITTHGGTKPENCHPFPISDSVKLLQKPVVLTSCAVAHNGIIDIKTEPNISDTMQYIISQLSYIKRLHGKFYDNKYAMQLIANAIRSKMAFLPPDGKFRLIGDFEEKDGIFYSNSSYEPRKLFSWGKWNNYAYDDYDYTELRRLSWLEDTAEFVKDNKGNILDAENYLIDEKGGIYRYFHGANYAIRMYGYSAKPLYHGAPLFDDDNAEFIEVWL